MAATAPTPDALVQRLIGASVTSGGMVVVIVLVTIVPIMGILAAIAIPAYQDYTIRSQITEGLNLASAVKAGVAEVYAGTSRWPLDAAEAGVEQAITGKYTSSVEVDNGIVVITYGNQAHGSISGGVVTLRPAAIDGDVVWSCGYTEVASAGAVTAVDGESETTLPRKYLPRLCRGE